MEFGEYIVWIQGDKLKGYYQLNEPFFEPSSDSAQCVRQTLDEVSTCTSDFLIQSETQTKT